jgi:putative acetyltransferase
MTAPRAVDVRPETPADVDAVRGVNAAAFGRPDEGRLVDALREHAALCVSLVALEEGRVSGHIAFSPATLGDAGGPVVIAALGPMAVMPDRQRLGVGSALVRAGLDACRRRGHEVVVVLGHPAFYPHFGFVSGRLLGVTCEYPVPDEAFMVTELSPGALRGRRGLVLYGPDFALAAD